jgi:hypothetical protein
MAEAAELQAVGNSTPRTPKDKSCLLEVIDHHRGLAGLTGDSRYWFWEGSRKT